MKMRDKLNSRFPNEVYDGFLEFVERYELSGEQVARLFISWHGTDIVSRKFVENLEGAEEYDLGGDY